MSVFPHADGAIGKFCDTQTMPKQQMEDGEQGKEASRTLCRMVAMSVRTYCGSNAKGGAMTGNVDTRKSFRKLDLAHKWTETANQKCERTWGDKAPAWCPNTEICSLMGIACFRESVDNPDDAESKKEPQAMMLRGGRLVPFEPRTLISRQASTSAVKRQETQPDISYWGKKCSGDYDCGSQQFKTMASRGLKFPKQYESGNKLRCHKKACVFVHPKNNPVNNEWGMLAVGSNCKQDMECRRKGADGKYDWSKSATGSKKTGRCIKCGSGTCQQSDAGGFSWCAAGEDNIDKKPDN